MDGHRSRIERQWAWEISLPGEAGPDAILISGDSPTAVPFTEQFLAQQSQHTLRHLLWATRLHRVPRYTFSP